MPYIGQEQRAVLDEEPLRRVGTTAASPGQLNYAISRIINSYWLHGESYTTANDIVGALENAKDEFQRRHLHPYENRKMEENGDL